MKKGEEEEEFLLLITRHEVNGVLMN